MEKRFPNEQSDLSGFTNLGRNGSLVYAPAKILKVHDEKAVEFDRLRRAIREKFPDIKTKKRLKDTVRYNWKLQHPRRVV